MALPIHAARRRATIGARVDGVNGLTPALYYVQVDHLNRPVRLTNAAKAAVWTAVWKPFGEPQAITGAASLDARFPGQWFQLESGLSYNWHRHYDATTGRYAQPDPLGFVDGPGVFGYARQSPLASVDPLGLYDICVGNPDPLSGCGKPGQGLLEGGGGAGTSGSSVAGPGLWDLLRGAWNVCLRTFSGSGGGGGDADCDKEWEEARRTCRDELLRPNPSHDLTGGYSDVANCAKGLVSERCGGNPVDRIIKPRKKRWPYSRRKP